MNIKKWFSDQSFLKKFILIYVVCAAIPMLLMMIYSYQQTSKLLIDQAYSDLRQNVTAMENSLNYAYQPYETIMRTLSNDRLVNTQLTLDYTNLSYSDIAYYQNTTLSELEVLNPGLAWIRFYSSNKTLPNDHYLSPLEELGEGPAQSADALRGQAAISGYALERGEDTIVMLSRMNYYSTDAIKNYLALGIHRSLVAEQLQQNSSGRKVYLLDTSGRVLISSDGSLDLQPMTDILPNWESLPLGQIQRQTAGGSDLLCLRTELDMGMALVMTIDRASLLRSVRSIPLRTLAVFTVLSLAAYVVVFLYSRSQHRRLHQIIHATEQIGDGDFSGGILPNLGQDELGQIAGAVNQMNSRIDQLIQENYKRQLMVKSSEVNLLQEQINPHFLYNALAGISSVAMREGGKRTMQSVRYLSDFYRLSLNKGAQVITVEEEVELLQSYMKIQQIRFEDSLEIDYDVDPKALHCATIKLILQPLVENAIHHARREESVLHIRVRVSCLSDRIQYEVEDDGIGIEPEILKQLQEELPKMEGGFGLKNVDVRVRLNYGNEYGVSIASQPGHGTTVRVNIPQIEKE